LERKRRVKIGRRLNLDGRGGAAGDSPEPGFASAKRGRVTARVIIEKPRPEPDDALDQRLWRRKKYRALAARRIDKIPPQSPVANLKISRP
jgi:hypothetical protein